MLSMKEAASFHYLPLRELSESCRRILSEGLNTATVKTTQDQVPRDYRGLAMLMEIAPEFLDQLKTSVDPTQKLLKLWGDDPTHTVGQLIEFLNSITRFDVVDDVHLALERYIPVSHESKREQTKNQVHIVSRREWGGAPLSKTNQQKLILPVNLVVVHHTKFPANGRDIPEVLHAIRERSRTITGDPEALEYNFVISTDGAIYEGTGWSISSFHNSRLDFTSLQIGLIGLYDEEIPDDRMMNGLQQLLQYGVAEGKLVHCFRVCGFCDIDPESSPGVKVMDVIRQWPNYRSAENVVNSPADYELTFGFR